MHVRRFAFAAAILSLAVSAPAFASVEKFMNSCDGKLCASFHASTAVPDGWVENAEASAALGVQMLLPKDTSFDDAPAKIYTLVKFDREKKPSTAFEKDMLADWRGRAASDKKAKIERLAEVSRGDGKPTFLSWRFEAPKLKDQGFERFSVTTDDDKDGNTFFVVVVLSANSRAALDAAAAAYDAMLKY